MNRLMATASAGSVACQYVLPVAMATLVACSERVATGPQGSMAVTVSPLTLPGIDDAEFGIHVYNAEGDLVWEQASLWTSRYGSGGDGLAYVGPCDATAPGTNTVQLVLRALKNDSSGTISPTTYVNPAPDVAVDDARALKRTVTCVENGDVPVVFNLTIARDAQQGFFDIAVEFEDVFCSAKLDCVDKLLHHGDEREPTAVMGFACAAGGDQPVSLYLSNVGITCRDTGGSVTFEHSFRAAALDEGNQGGVGPIFQVGHYWGKEEFDFDKCYWNHAFGLDLAALAGLGSCELEAWGTASHQAWFDLTTPEGYVYPVVHWKVPLTESGTIVCGEHPIGSEEVEVVYVDGDLERQGFGASYTCGEDPIVGDQSMDCGGEAEAELTTDGQLTVTVYVDGRPVTDTLNIGPGARLVDECCLHSCCGGN